MKSQRIRITEKGWGNYTGHFGGIEFKDGLSTEIVDPMIATRLGSLVGIKMVDTDEQAGVAADMQRMVDVRAEVVPELPRGVQQATTPEVKEVKPTYTREFLEAEADARGIAGLRAIGDKIGVRGRGIGELIENILKAQV